MAREARQVTAARSPDRAVFIDALAHLASGVAVIAFWYDGSPHGLLVSSLTGLSVDPPRMLFCLRKAAASHDMLLIGTRCSISVLGEHDELDAERFSRAELWEQRFASSLWDLTDSRAPLYKSGVAGFVGAVDGIADAGSHSIVVVEIEAAQNRAGRPLIHFGRRFHGLTGSP